MVKITEEQLHSSSGAILQVYQCRAKAKKPKGIVQINHGLTEHSGRYIHFMQYLADHGYSSIAHDHRGHGKTRTDRFPLGTFAKKNGTSKVLKDVSFINSKMRSEFPDQPIICFGHSLGALIAMNYAQQLPSSIKALALWNVNFKAAQIAPLAQFALALEAFFLGSDVPSPTISKLTFERWSKTIDNADSPFDWLTHDAEAIDTISNDELGSWKPSIAMWRDIFKFISSGGNQSAIKNLPNNLPIQLIAGGEDPATDYGEAVRWLADYLVTNGKTDISFKIYREFRHETLNEMDNERAMEDFVFWADKAIKL